MSAPAPAAAETPAPTGGFVNMTDEEAIYQEEVAIMEKRGRRLRRAALTAGIMQSIAIVCSIYTTIAIRWVLIEWGQPEKTGYEISESFGLFKFGYICDAITTVANTFVGVLVGLILIGAGVNPASSSLIITFRLIAQAIFGFSVVFMVAGGLFFDENSALYSAIKTYFYSDNQPPIGTQIGYLMLLINKYGSIFAQIFSGIHFLLLGLTIVMWGVFPRWMGYTLAIAGPCSILSSALFLIWPGYDGELTILLYLPITIAEFWMAGWMLVNTPHPAKNRDLFFASLFRENEQA